VEALGSWEAKTLQILGDLAAKKDLVKKNQRQKKRHLKKNKEFI